MSERIKEGDTVSIFFNTSEALHHVEIMHTPVATGDCFVVKDKRECIYNVQQYNYMLRLPKPPEETNV